MLAWLPIVTGHEAPGQVAAVVVPRMEPKADSERAQRAKSCMAHDDENSARFFPESTLRVKLYNGILALALALRLRKECHISMHPRRCGFLFPLWVLIPRAVRVFMIRTRELRE